MTISQLHQRFLQSSGVCTDSRGVFEKCIFFALKGANFNGNKFAREALQKGAVFAVVDEQEYADGDATILVNNVLESLQELAKFHRRNSPARIIALTGSNGKTTTKELVQAVLSKKYRTIATRGNLNNHIGVPLTLLGIRKDTELAIVELGANHKGEIAFLCSISKPDYGYITNFGKAHLEGFGGEEGVVEGKSELYTHLKDKGYHIFFNAEDKRQRELVGGYKNSTGFGSAETATCQIRFLEANPFVKMQMGTHSIQTQLVGNYNFNNCAAAAMIGAFFDVPVNQIKDALESYLPVNNRSQLLDKNGYQILLDAYNANPSSMVAALDNFENMPGKSKTVFLGDMFELGTSAREEHQQIASLAEKKGFSSVFLIGENFSKVKTSLSTFATFEAFEEYIRKNKPTQGNILIKGSRGMALERILESL
jgi:UDP-N-acetylmuramoyl-tripeptide--D-alanyl-D-alanine ligase